MGEPEPAEPENAGAALRGLIGAVILAAVGVTAWLAIGPDAGDAGQEVVTEDGATTSSTTAVTVTSTSVAPSTEPTVSTTAAPTTTMGADSAVRLLPAGLDCRALVDTGLSYSEVVRYWNGHAQPDELDPDGDGEPCEQVFPRSVIVAELGEPGSDVPPDGEAPGDPAATTVPAGTRLPPGLRCADLRARGVSVEDAIAYYLANGSPSRMDADRNGVPCETVYPDAGTAWNARR